MAYLIALKVSFQKPTFVHGRSFKANINSANRKQS